MSDIWAALKPQLEYFSRPFPQAAIDLANAHRDEVAPFLIACIEAIAADPAPTQDGDYMLHLYAMHLLAFWRDKRAYRPLAKLGHYPEQVVDEMMGDVVHETYGRALASVFDGDLQPIKTLVEDENASVWSRQSALEALTVLALEGDIDREALIAYLANLGECEAARLRALNVDAEDCELIDWVVSSATDVGAVSMLPAIRQWFDEGLLDEMFADEAWVVDNIAISPAVNLATLRYRNNSYVSDVAREMAWWVGFRDDTAPDKSFSPLPKTPAPVAPKIGRNDPCPCGSGRKYKKCHGSAV